MVDVPRRFANPSRRFPPFSREPGSLQERFWDRRSRREIAELDRKGWRARCRSVRAADAPSKTIQRCSFFPCKRARHGASLARNLQGELRPPRFLRAIADAGLLPVRWSRPMPGSHPMRLRIARRRLGFEQFILPSCQLPHLRTGRWRRALMTRWRSISPTTALRRLMSVRTGPHLPAHADRL